MLIGITSAHRKQAIQGGTGETTLPLQTTGSLGRRDALGPGAGRHHLRIQSYGYDQNMTVNFPNQFNVTVENLGPDPAGNVRLHATLPGEAELVPSAGCTQAGAEVTCTLPNLASGHSVSQKVRFIPRSVAKVRVEFEVLGSNDSNPANNRAGYDAKVFPQNVLYLTRIFLKASGTGHNAKDLSAVRLYEDTNANGRVDAGERLVQTLVFPIDDTLVLGGPTLYPDSPESRQVTYDLDDQVRPGTLGALAACAGLGLLALGFLARGPAQRLRRPFWG